MTSGEGKEMNEAEKQELISELKNFYKKLRSYKNRQSKRHKTKFTEAQNRSLDALRLELQREHGRLANIISKYGGRAYIPMPLLGKNYEVFTHSLGTLEMPFRGLDALDGAISVVNTAIGKLESITLAEPESSETIPAKPPKASEDHKEEPAREAPQKRQPFDEAWEIEIRGDLDTLHPIIATVARELSSRDFAYEARLASSKSTNTYAWYDVLVIEIRVMEKRPIGVFTLQSLGNNRTMLTVPPRSQWLHGGFTPKELMVMGYIEHDDNARRFHDEHFTKFIRSLEDRLTHYGLKVTPFKRLWQWIKTHKIHSIIYVAIITAVTLLGINWSIVVENFKKFLELFG